MSIKVLIGLNIPQPDGSEIRLEPDGKIYRDVGLERTEIGGNPEDFIPATSIKSLSRMTPPAIEIIDDKPAARQGAKTSGRSSAPTITITDNPED